MLFHKKIALFFIQLDHSVYYFP